MLYFDEKDFIINKYAEFLSKKINSFDYTDMFEICSEFIEEHSLEEEDIEMLMNLEIKNIIFNGEKNEKF